MAKPEKHHPRKVVETPGILSRFTPLQRDLFSIALLYLITLVVFRGIIFSNAAFAVGGDTAAGQSYAHVGQTIAKTEGVDPLWMPQFFSGMPTFGNVAFLPHNVNYLQTVVEKVVNLFYLNGTWTWYIVYSLLGGVFMFLLLRQFNLPRPAAVLGAVTFMLSPYAVGLAGEGHGSKLIALSYVPMAFLLTHVLLERRNLLSLGLFSIGIGTLLLANHMQIAYYTFGLIGLYALIVILPEAKASPGRALGRTALLAAGLLVGLLISSYVYFSVYEFSFFSFRGSGQAGVSGGLAWEYATNWSWHPAELITLLIPGFFGLQASTYWGSMTPWQNSSVYVGLLPLICAAIALRYRRTPMVLFLAGVTLLIILVSFGRNFAPLYDLLFSTLPFFNKFRAPVMILHLLPLLAGFLGAYGLAALLEEKEWRNNQRRSLGRFFLVGAGILGALALLTLLFKSALPSALGASFFLREGDLAQLQQQYGQRASQALAQIKLMRFEIFWKDLLKFALLGGIMFALFWAFLSEKLKKGSFVTLIVALAVIDLWFVSSKYITPEPAAEASASFASDATVEYLKQQPGMFRVFPVGQLFMDNTFAYHGLQSIGGYSPAKLKIYQTLLDSCLERPLTPDFPWNMNVLNMLNTGYLVVPGLLPENPHVEQANLDQARRLVTYRNPHALPRAWFVHDLVVARSDAEVFERLNSPAFDPAATAILTQAPSVAIGPPDSSARVEFVAYQSRRITLSTTAAAPALLVLSEIYYPAGWSVTIDGKEAEILRTNYVLRSVAVPEGKHEIVFAFDPPVYRAGWILTHVAWGAALVAVLAGLWPLLARWRRRRGGTPVEHG